jgi:tetratricopeptide (TPR) repeat protein
MKSLFLLLFLTLYSCGHNRGNKVTKENLDAFSDESFLRYSSIRLKNSKHMPKFKGTISCHQGQINKGLSWLRDNLKSESHKASYWNQLGTCYYLQGNNQKAIYFYNKSVKQGGNAYSPAFNNLGVLHLKLGHSQKAMINFTKAKNISPNLIAPYFNLAQLYLEFGMPRLSLKELSNIKVKDDIDILAIKAISYIAINKSKIANKLYSKIPKEFQRRDYIAIPMALSFIRTGRLQLAKETLSNVQGIKDKNLKKLQYELEELIEERLDKEG